MAADIDPASAALLDEVAAQRREGAQRIASRLHLQMVEIGEHDLGRFADREPAEAAFLITVVDIVCAPTRGAGRMV